MLFAIGIGKLYIFLTTLAAKWSYDVFDTNIIVLLAIGLSKLRIFLIMLPANYYVMFYTYIIMSCNRLGQTIYISI